MLQDCFLESRPADAVAIVPVIQNEFQQWLEQQAETWRRWVQRTGFSGKAGSICLVPDEQQALAAVLVGAKTKDDPWICGGLSGTLPAGNYYLATDWSAEELNRATLAWGLGAYQFSRYKKNKPIGARLALDDNCDGAQIQRQLQAITLVRDLINTPAEDMMPENLAEAATALAQDCNAEITQIVGDDLLAQNYPMIHAVGRASVHAPRLLDLRWGGENRPKVTLVGKGVCFDSGGLDLKSANAMRLMKKDMGGAAHVLGLAQLIMRAGLPVRLRVLVAAVENAVAGNALRPGDVIRSRKGLSIEIHNTDAEGRLILCDALAEAAGEKPDVIIDFATLTGSARVALGTDIPALFCNNDALADGLLNAAQREHDPLWRLPLHKPYREMLDSKIADIVNASSGSYAGAITAALFLQEFAPADSAWAHLDLMAWNTKARPGRPEGGEAMGLRAVYRYLQERFGN